MNYIVFDLEWNQCPTAKKQGNPRASIRDHRDGAVKLDEPPDETGRFHRVIRPSVYPSLNSHTREMVQMDEDKLGIRNPFS